MMKKTKLKTFENSEEKNPKAEYPLLKSQNKVGTTRHLDPSCFTAVTVPKEGVPHTLICFHLHDFNQSKTPKDMPY